MTPEEKARILDSLNEECGHIATYLAKADRPCTCDLDVGWVCEECSTHQILSRVAGIHRCYQEEEKGKEQKKKSHLFVDILFAIALISFVALMAYCAFEWDRVMYWTPHRGIHWDDKK